MCDAATPIDVLKRIPFGLHAMVEATTTEGSSQREAMRLMAKGVERDIQWVITNLEQAGEGKKNFGLTKY